jgi:hypothetical protein
MKSTAPTAQYQVYWKFRKGGGDWTADEWTFVSEAGANRRAGTIGKQKGSSVITVIRLAGNPPKLP